MPSERMDGSVQSPSAKAWASWSRRTHVGDTYDGGIESDQGLNIRRLDGV